MESATSYVDINELIDSMGVPHIDENGAETLEIEDFECDIDGIDCSNLDILNSELSINRRIYLPKWRRKFITTKKPKSSRKLIFCDDIHCISMINVSVRRKILFIRIHLRSSNIDKLGADIAIFKELINELMHHYKCTRYKCTLTMMSLHKFIEGA